MNPDSKNRMTVEDLLRLKRCERPQPEFWTHFEQELRAKQLAAIVEKRPFWAGFSRILHRFSPFSLPLGAAAAFVATLVGFHEYRVIARAGSGSGVAGDIPSATVSGSEGGLASNLSDTEDSVDREGTARVSGSSARVSTVSYRETVSPGPSSLRPWGVVARRDGWLDVTDSPSARSIAANLATVQAAQPEMIRNLLSLSQRFDSQLVPERRPVAEPLGQIDSPSEERRSRILADALPVSAQATEVSPPASDRLVRRLTDDRFYEEAASRYHLGGGDQPSLSIKF